MKLKQQILDGLDKAHDFPLPESLVANEFDSIWKQLTQSLEQAGKTLADEGRRKSEDELKAEYRKIAERRVRLGLVIGEIGEKASVQVSQDELRRALIEQARRYPGQEKFVYEYYEKNPAALVELRAPIFEDKVIDHILGQAKPTDKKVTVEELLKSVGGRTRTTISATIMPIMITTMTTITTMTMIITTMTTTTITPTTMGTTTITAMITATTTGPEKK